MDQLNEQLIISAERGDLEGVIDALIQGADIHDDNDYALRFSAQHGRLNMVRYLLQDAGANIHAENDEALRWSARNGHLDVVEYLLQEVDPPADIHANNDEALRWSALNGHLPVVRYLLQEADPPADIHADDDSALILSAANGQLHMVRYLLEEAGADIHALNEQALSRSAYWGHLPVVRYLLQDANPPADIHAMNDRALRNSALNEKWDVATYLVWKGSDINRLEPEERYEIQRRRDDPDLIQNEQLRWDLWEYKRGGVLKLKEQIVRNAEREGLNLERMGVPEHIVRTSYPRSTSLKSRINHLLSCPITPRERGLLISLL